MMCAMLYCRFEKRSRKKMSRPDSTEISREIRFDRKQWQLSKTTCKCMITIENKLLLCTTKATENYNRQEMNRLQMWNGMQCIQNSIGLSQRFILSFQSFVSIMTNIPSICSMKVKASRNDLFQNEKWRQNLTKINLIEMKSKENLLIFFLVSPSWRKKQWKLPLIRVTRFEYLIEWKWVSCHKKSKHTHRRK